MFILPSTHCINSTWGVVSWIMNTAWEHETWWWSCFVRCLTMSDQRNMTVFSGHDLDTAQVCDHSGAHSVESVVSAIMISVSVEPNHHEHCNTSHCLQSCCWLQLLSGSRSCNISTQLTAALTQDWNSDYNIMSITPDLVEWLLADQKVFW